MSRLRLSVAICTFNGAEYLPQQLESFAAQVRQPDEMVIFDDCSTDNTVQLIKYFSKNVTFPVELHINDQNLGSTKNFEKAIGSCKGDIIVLSDQDDVWHPCKLELLEEVFKKFPNAGMVFSDAAVVDKDLNELGYRLWDASGFGAKQQRLMGRGQYLQVLLRRTTVTGATMAFRSTFRDLILPIPFNFVHDEWISLLLGAVSELRFVPQPLILYRQHGNNQIGGSKKGFGCQLEEASHYRSAAYREYFDKYALVKERLLSAGKLGAKTLPIELIEQKMKHLRKRASLPPNRLLSVYLILWEALTLGYTRYSNGWKSVAKDLFYSQRSVDKHS